MSEAREVYVRKPHQGEHYTCQLTRRGWKCGHCGRGNLGFAPRDGQLCRVCLFRVSQIITTSDITFDDLSRIARMD